MGDFITSPTTPELFDDKEAAPGLTRRPGWTETNVLDADDVNAMKAALFDCRTAIRDIQDGGSATTGTAVLAFGGPTVTSSGHYLPPGYGTSDAAAINTISPVAGTITQIAFSSTAGSDGTTVHIYINGVLAETADFGSATTAWQGSETAVAQGDQIAVAVTWTTSSPARAVVTLALESEGAD